MYSAEAIPNGLSTLDAEVLIDFVTRQPTMAEVMHKRGLDAAAFLHWWDSPPIAAALDTLLRIHALRRDLRNEQIREELTQILAQVARTSPSPVEQRRAASDAQRALRTPFQPVGRTTSRARVPAPPDATAPASPSHRFTASPPPLGAPSSSSSNPRSISHGAHRAPPHGDGVHTGQPTGARDSPSGTPLVSLARALAPDRPDERHDRHHPPDPDDPDDPRPRQGPDLGLTDIPQVPEEAGVPHPAGDAPRPAQHAPPRGTGFQPVIPGHPRAQQQQHPDQPVIEIRRQVIDPPPSPDRLPDRQPHPEHDRQSAAESQHPASLPPAAEAHGSPCDPIAAELASIEAEVNRLLGPDRDDDDAWSDRGVQPADPPADAPLPQTPLAYAEHILERAQTDPDAFPPEAVRAARIYSRFMDDARPRPP